MSKYGLHRICSRFAIIFTTSLLIRKFEQIFFIPVKPIGVLLEINWEFFTCQALQGNEDKDTVMIHWLERFFDARYVRVHPLSWYGENICMRVELYGCITGTHLYMYTV